MANRNEQLWKTTTTSYTLNSSLFLYFITSFEREDERNKREGGSRKHKRKDRYKFVSCVSLLLFRRKKTMSSDMSAETKTETKDIVLPRGIGWECATTDPNISFQVMSGNLGDIPRIVPSEQDIKDYNGKWFMTYWYSNVALATFDYNTVVKTGLQCSTLIEHSPTLYYFTIYPSIKTEKHTYDIIHQILNTPTTTPNTRNEFQKFIKTLTKYPL